MVYISAKWDTEVSYHSTSVFSHTMNANSYPILDTFYTSSDKLRHFCKFYELLAVNMVPTLLLKILPYQNQNYYIWNVCSEKGCMSRDTQKQPFKTKTTLYLEVISEMTVMTKNVQQFWGVWYLQHMYIFLL